jgi:radical SAM protein with 4Fe4S-binding SPASM domain
MSSLNVVHFDGLVDFLADLGAARSQSELRIQLLVGVPERRADLYPSSAMTDDEICRHLDRACERAEARGLRFRVELDEPFRRSVQPVPPRFRWIMGHLVNCLNGHVRERYPRFCSMATYHLKIAPNGDVFPCCRAPEELTMGNVNEQTVEEIWNGERYRRFRRQMFSGDYPASCANCDVLVANPHFERSEGAASREG